MGIAVFVVCTIFGLLFAFYAFRSMVNEKWGPAGMFGVLASIALLSGLPWFHGLGTAVITGVVRSQFTALAEQIKNVQEESVGLQKQIDTNQMALKSAQRDIDEAQKRLSIQQQLNLSNQMLIATMQTNLTTAQSNVLTQAKQLENVEYWVVNLFSNMMAEEFSLSDTNRVVKIANGVAVRYFLLLKYAPIENSVKTRLRGHGFADAEVTTPSTVLKGETHSGPMNANVVVVGLVGYPESSTRITVEYVRDSRIQKVSKRIKEKDGVIFLDDVGININYKLPTE